MSQIFQEFLEKFLEVGWSKVIRLKLNDARLFHEMTKTVFKDKVQFVLYTCFNSSVFIGTAPNLKPISLNG